MNKSSHRASAWLWALATFVAGGGVAQALCWDPKTLISGYKLDLDYEVKATALIIVGNVTAQRDLQEDATDPDGITASIYTIQVVRRLKGTAPKTIYVRSENYSSRYPMAVGQQHLLFLAKVGAYFEADSCGNSSLLPKGQATLERVEVALKAQATALPTLDILRQSFAAIRRDPAPPSWPAIPDIDPEPLIGMPASAIRTALGRSDRRYGHYDWECGAPVCWVFTYDSLKPRPAPIVDSPTPGLKTVIVTTGGPPLLILGIARGRVISARWQGQR